MFQKENPTNSKTLANEAVRNAHNTSEVYCKATNSTYGGSVYLLRLFRRLVIQRCHANISPSVLATASLPG